MVDINHIFHERGSLNSRQRHPVKTWSKGVEFDEGTFQQLANVASMPFIHKHVAAMPDAHVGIGATVGSVIATKGAIIPAAVGVDLGCVDAETEFLSPSGWVRIDEWNGQDVLQFDLESNSCVFATPIRYIAEPCDVMLAFKTKYGINQVLSVDHRMLTFKAGRKRSFTTPEVLTASEVKERHDSRVLGFGNAFRCDIPFNPPTSVPFSDDMIRLICAVAADSTLDKNRAVVHFRKRRKIERMEYLLRKNGIEYSKNDLDPEIGVRISFEWSYGKRLDFWQASRAQLEIIADEVIKWDGNADDQVFFTRIKEEADFIQYCFSVCGFRATLRADSHQDGKVDYRVFRVENPYTGLKGSPKSSVKEVTPSDRMKYCFTMPSGYFIIRRGGNIVITGNCGMMAYQLSITENDLPSSLGHVRAAMERATPHGRTNDGRAGDRGAWENVPLGAMHRWTDLVERYNAILEKHPKAKSQNHVNHLGTLGTGNHFIELCADETGQLWVMLHSGSRGVGNRLGSYFIEKAKEEMERCHISEFLPDKDCAYLVEKTELFNDYIDAVQWAQDFASENRKQMMEQTLRALREVLPPFALGKLAVNCHHNYIAYEYHFGDKVWVTRKGAVRAGQDDLGIIPGSMATGSFIVRGKGNPESFCSCSHGAGRRMSRTQAKKVISLEDHVKATIGVECRKDADVIDESPAAYKDLQAVINAQTDLIEVVHRLRTLVNVKG